MNKAYEEHSVTEFPSEAVLHKWVWDTLCTSDLHNVWQFLSESLSIKYNLDLPIGFLRILEPDESFHRQFSTWGNNRSFENVLAGQRQACSHRVTNILEKKI